MALDFDDIGSMVGEELGRKRTSTDPGKVGNADTFEG
jgi:hypothetical protein